MSFGLDHLKDPLTSGNLLSSLLPLITQFMDRRAQQNDPNTLGFVNNLIGDYNASNAYNPQTGQFRAGNPYGDAASGYGGAFGSDSQGNPLSPSGAFTQYALSQIQGGQGVLDQRQANLANLAASAGGNVSAPSGYSLNTPQGLNPGAVQGVDQSVRRPPTALQELQPQEDFISRAQDRMGPGGGGLLGLGLADRFRGLVGSYAVGTSSVPQTGLAQVHQGEMIVPAGQNPNRLPPGQPGVPLQQPGGGGKGAYALPTPVNNFGGGAAPSGPTPQMPPPSPAPPMAAPQAAMAGATPGAAPPAGGGGYGPLQPGLSPEVQQQVINRSVDVNNRESQALQAQLATQAALSGQTGGGLERQLFDAELARSGQNAQINQNVGIEAANRQFADQLAANNFYLSRDLGMGQLGVQQGQLGLARDQLGLQGELGRGQLALDRDLGEGQLDLQGGRLDLDRTLGQGQLANDTFLAQLQERLGMGQLDLQQQQFGLDQQLGLGQLGLQQGELDLNRLLGEGQLGLQRDQFGLDQQLGLGQLGIQQGQLGLQRDQFGLDQQLGLGQLGIQQGQLGLQRDQFGLDQQLGLGQLGLQRDQFGLDQQLGLGQLGLQQGGLDLNRLLGEGQLGLQRDQFGLDQERVRGELDLNRLLGEGQLGIQQGELDLSRFLGQGGLDFQNRSFDAEYGRSLDNDLFGAFQYLQDNANTQSQNLLQQQYMGDQQNQFGQLLGLLSQYSGQAGSSGTTTSTGSSGTSTSGGGGLVGGGLQQRIGDSLRQLFGLAA